MIYAFIIVLIAIAVLLYIYKSSNTNEKEFTKSIEYVIVDLYMQGKIDIDTYLGYSLNYNDKYNELHCIKRYEKFKKGELYPDGEVGSKINKDLEK